MAAQSKDRATTKRQFSIIDFFEDLGEWAEKNATALVIGFTGVVVACIFAVGVSIYQNSVQEKHFAEAYEIEKQFVELITTAEEPNPENPTPMMSALTPEKISEIQPRVLAFVKAHPRSDASRNMAIKWVSKLYDMKAYEQAVSVMQELKPNSKSSISGLALLLKGTALMEAGQNSEAMQVFQEILKHEHWAYVHPEASYHLSMAQVKNNDPDAAILSLKHIHDHYADKKEISAPATKVMRWLQYQKAQKSQTTTATN